MCTYIKIYCYFIIHGEQKFSCLYNKPKSGLHQNDITLCNFPKCFCAPCIGNGCSYAPELKFSASRGPYGRVSNLTMRFSNALHILFWLSKTEICRYRRRHNYETNSRKTWQKWRKRWKKLCARIRPFSISLKWKVALKCFIGEHGRRKFV